MSFLFGKKNKPSASAARDAPSALPPATRDITSSHGPTPQPPAPRDLEKVRGPSQATTPVGGSANNSFSSLQNQGNTASPEPSMRNRGEVSPQPLVHLYEKLLTMYSRREILETPMNLRRTLGPIDV